MSNFTKLKPNRFRDFAENNVDSLGSWGLVVFYFDHDFLLHSQYGRLPYYRKNGKSNKKRRGSVQSK